jgi:hypothetical protein
VAFSEPSICERFPPVMRFSVAPLPLLKNTLLPALIEKPCQLMMPWLVD